MSHHVIEIHDIKKTFVTGGEPLEILHGISFTIDEGELVAIMGSSGSGKSTLMNILGCLDKPTAGSYALDGHDVARMDKNELAETRNKALGFVFQSFNLLARTAALENVELPMMYAGVAASERHQRARAALERVGLAERLDHRPNQLSGGQQQRVAIARALVTEPKLILADEPTGNLDSKTSIEVMALFQALNRAGITIVLVTHEPDIAELTSRTIVMKDGRVQADHRHAAKRALPPEPAS